MAKKKAKRNNAMKYIGIILSAVIVFLAVRSVALKIRDSRTSIDINHLIGDDTMFSCAIFAGSIKIGERATMVLVKGRPDMDITDMSIIQIWGDGKPIMKNSKFF